MTRRSIAVLGWFGEWENDATFQRAGVFSSRVGGNRHIFAHPSITTMTGWIGFHLLEWEDMYWSTLSSSCL